MEDFYQTIVASTLFSVLLYFAMGIYFKCYDKRMEEEVKRLSNELS